MTTETEAPSTFLIWVPGAKNKSARDSKDQIFQRHRHAALVHHQRRKERRSYEPLRILSKPLRKHPSAGTSSDDHDDRESSIPTPNELPLQPLAGPNSGRADPFDALCVRGFPNSALALVQFAINNQWPAFASSSKPETIEFWKKRTMSYAVEAPYLLQAITYAGACYQIFFGSSDSSIQMVHVRSQHSAVQSLRRAIEASNGNISDAMLMSMAILGIHTSSSPKYSEPISRAALYRDNDFYSSQIWNPTHIEALMRLVKHKGGLKTIGIYDFREMVAVIDIQTSLDTLRTPEFPLMTRTDVMMQSLCARTTMIPPARSEASAKGFSFLKTLSGGPSLLKPIQKIRSLLQAYDLMLQCGPGSGIDFHFLLATRRGLQHDVLSTAAQSEDALYSACRLAVIAYMGESIEPHSSPRPFHACLSKALMLALDKCDRLSHASTSTGEYTSFLTWSAVVGAFTARDTPLLHWYFGFIRGLRQPGTLGEWEDVQKEAESFLPFKYRQGAGCQQVWEALRAWSPATQFPLTIRAKSAL